MGFYNPPLTSRRNGYKTALHCKYFFLCSVTCIYEIYMILFENPKLSKTDRWIKGRKTKIF